MKPTLIRALLFASLPLAQTAFAFPGELDPSFSADGLQTVALNLGEADNGNNQDRAHVLVRVPGGRVYQAGSANIVNNRFAIAIARLRHDGSLDEAFGKNGRMVYPELFASAQALDGILDASQRLLLTGAASVQPGDFEVPFVCRFLPDGTPDLDFGGGDVPGCTVMKERGTATALLQQDDKLLMVGFKTVEGEGTIGTIHRLDATGELDQTFGKSGVAELSSSLVTLFRDAVIAGNGDIFAVGAFTTLLPFQDDLLVARFTAEGMPVSDFYKDGLYIENFNLGPPGFTNDIGTAAMAVDDGIVVVGHAEANTAAQHRPVVVKFDAQGFLDDAFGKSGLRYDYDPCMNVPGGCDVRPNDVMAIDGRWILSGGLRTQNFGRHFALRLLPDGEQDASFGNSLVPGQEGLMAPAWSLVPDQPDAAAYRAIAQGARILLGGDVEVPQVGNSPASNFDFGAMRLDHGLEGVFFDVTPQTNQGGSLGPAGVQSVAHSDIIEFVVTVNPGFELVSVEGCGGALYGNVFSTDPITADCTVTATFQPLGTPTGSIFGDGFEDTP